METPEHCANNKDTRMISKVRYKCKQFRVASAVNFPEKYVKHSELLLKFRSRIFTESGLVRKIK